MERMIKINDGWFFHEGEVNVERPTVKTIVYATAKTVRKGIGPASTNYREDPDAWISEAGWEKVSLPHDYIVKQNPDNKQNWTLGHMKNPNAWYRRHLRFSEEDKNKRITLYFEGIATASTIYFNGCLLKHNFTAYTPFEVDITDYVQFENDNVIAVYVDAAEYEGWWYQGAGIYRNVWLKKTDKVCIDLYGVYAKPVKINENEWQVEFETTVRNENWNGNAKRVTAVSSIYNADGVMVAKAEGTALVPAKDKKTVTYKALVNNPEIWDVDSPNLYTVKTEIFKNSNVCDVDETRIGFRTAVCDPEKGFILNGRKVIIKGVCVHQDFGLTGLAVPDNIHHHKVEILKGMGTNGVRCSHYMNATAFMDALDENGMITMAETRWFESSEDGKRQLETLIKRDRNRPSIFFWSIGNEEKVFARDYGKRICQSLYSIAKKLDDQRFVMCAVDVPKESLVYDCCDVIGINYNLQHYADVHKRFPNKAVFASEYAATGTTRGYYFDNEDSQGRVTSYSAADTYLSNNFFMAPGRENSWKFFMENEWIMGGYQWVGIDYRGEAMWPRLSSASGSFDMFLQKKDTFYQNLSHWGTQPMIHLLPHWNWKGMENEIVKVWAYTNCTEAELFLNGKSLGRKQIEKYSHTEWLVNYESGELKVIGYIDGKKACEDIKNTTGEAVNIKLRLENNNVKGVGDIALFTCYAVDKDGNEVPDATDFINFYSGNGCKIVGTGSDPSDQAAVSLPLRKMYQGFVSVAVRVENDNTDTLKLFAESEKLGKAVLNVKFK